MDFLDDATLPAHRVWPGFDECRGPNGGYRRWINTEMTIPALDLLNGAPPGSIEPGVDDIPVPIQSLRAVGVGNLVGNLVGSGMSLYYQHTDYMIDEPLGLNPASQVMCVVKGDDDMPLPDVFTRVFMPGGRSGLCMNAIFMFHDFITLTDDPARSIELMGFGRAMRLSAISRARRGGMKELRMTRRRLFSMALSYAMRDDLDWFLLIAAAAECGPGGLKGELDRYSDVPYGFIVETMRAKAMARM